MSYRNPTIVNDQSGAVLGQAIALGAQNIAKGIIGMEAQNRAAKERAAEQAKIDEKKAIADANAQVAVIQKNAENAQDQYDRVQKNMKNVGDNFGISMKSAVDRLGQYNIDFINDKSPEKIKQIKEANEEIAALNEIITDWGAYLPEASNYSQLASSDIMNNVSYTSIGGDDGSKAKATINAIMGSEEYSYDLVIEDGKNYLQIKGPDGVDFKLNQNDLKSIGPLYNKREESGPQEMQNSTKGLVMIDTNDGEEIQKSLFATTPAKEGSEEKPLAVPLEKTSSVDPDGYLINRQKLNSTKLDQIIVPEQLRVLTKIEDLPKGKRNLFLRDYRISPTVYDNATPEERTSMVEDSVKDNFLQTYNMKEDEGEYYLESRGEKVSDESKKDVQLNKVYKKYSTGITKLNATTTAADAVQEIIRFANLGEGATISRGSSSRYATKEITLNDNFIATITVGDGEGDYDSTQKYDLRKIEEAENFIRNKTGIYDPTQLDTLATALSKKANSFSN